jgi:folate-binding Fe-S cluster repair protein YgfZ
MSSSTIAPCLRLEGPDTRPFLQGLITGNTDQAVRPDHPLYAALLTAQGKIVVDFILADAGEAILLDCAAAQRATLPRG